MKRKKNKVITSVVKKS